MTSTSVLQTFQNNLDEILIEMIRKSSTKKRKALDQSNFYCVSSISISLNTYIKRLLFYMELTNEHFFLALKYAERIFSQKCFKNKKLSTHKLMFACLMAACKFLEDDAYSLCFYSRVSGIKCNDLFELELEFYEAINFDLYVSEEEYKILEMEIKEKEKRFNAINQPNDKNQESFQIQQERIRCA